MSEDAVDYIGIFAGFALFAIPLAIMAQKAGRSPFLALWVAVPIVGILLILRMIAYGNWPNAAVPGTDPGLTP